MSTILEQAMTNAMKESEGNDSGGSEANNGRHACPPHPMLLLFLPLLLLEFLLVLVLVLLVLEELEQKPSLTVISHGETKRVFSRARGSP